MEEIIIIPPVNSKLRKYLKDGEETIQLFGTHLRMVGKGRVSELSDTSDIPEEMSYDYDIYIDKSSVTSIKLLYNGDMGKYQIVILHSAMLDSIMPNRELGVEVLKKLVSWRWNT